MKSIDRENSYKNQIYYRTLIFGAIVNPLWWFILHHTMPDLEDSLPVRLTIAGIFLLVAGGGRLFKVIDKHIANLYIACCCLISAHIFYLGYLNSLKPVNVVMIYIVIYCVASTFYSMRSLLIYVVASLIMTGGLVVTADPLFPISIFLSGLATTFIVLFIAAFNKDHAQNLLREANDELAISKERLLNAQKLSKVGNFEYTNSTGMFDCSDECLRIFGIPVTENPITYSRYRAIFLEEDMALIDLQREKLILEGKTGEYERKIVREDGKVLYVTCRYESFRNEKGEVEKFKAVVIDNTERKIAEHTIHDQQRKIVQSSKLSALGDMAGRIAHEINNPLTVIHGRAGQLKDLASLGPVDSNTVIKLTEKIELTSARIAKIIKALKTFACSGEDDLFVNISLKEVIDNTLVLCGDKFLNHSIQLDLSGVPVNIFLECQSAQIGQVIFNLLNNSCDAVEMFSEKWVKIQVIEHEYAMDVTVTDSGPGIPITIREKLFQPFFTSKIIGMGTGLGLTVSKSILEKHNGTITVNHDCPNTQFVITLPYVQKIA